MKASLPLAFIFLVLGAVEGYSYNLTQQKKSTSTASSSPRRRFLRDAAAMAGGLLIGSRSTNVRAVEDFPTPVYFGVGVSSSQLTFYCSLSQPVSHYQ